MTIAPISNDALSAARAEVPVVAVIGGGFSGLLTAIHLLARDPKVVVRLVEKADRFGPGRAYAAANAHHILNVRASNMSAFPDQPDHFRDWLAAGGDAPDGFVSRGRFGEYLQHLLWTAISSDDCAGRLLLERDEAVDIVRGDRWDVHLAMGRQFSADAVVLAIGLATPAAPAPSLAALKSPSYIADPWSTDLTDLPDGDILLIGSGLTMVDTLFSLAGEARRFTVISRHGLLPRSHGATAAAPIPPGPLQSPRAALASLRAHAAAVGWRSAVDSLRPLTPAIWRDWSLKQRRQFLRHGRAWWDVHRHRMAPQVAARLQAFTEAGQVDIIAARIEGVSPSLGGLDVQLRRRGSADTEARTFAAVVNCAGLSGDTHRLAPLTGLAEQGLVAPDPLGLGLDVDLALRARDRHGQATPGLYVVGPLTRGARWEAVAVPDLRLQALEAAQQILADLGAVGGILADAPDSVMT